MGRGIVYGLLTRTLFIVGAYVIHVYAGRVLKPELYGTFGVILAILAISSIFYSNGVREAIAKNISTHPQCARYIFSVGLLVQLAFGIPIAIVIFLFADHAARVFQDHHLALPLKICSAVILAQCLYYVYLGTLNGLRKFLAESVVGIVYSVVRPVTVVLAIGAGYGVAGAVWGFLIASVLAAVVGHGVRGALDNTPIALSFRQMLTPATSNILTFGAITVLLNVDLLFVKNLVSSADAAGLYTAASAFSKPPYWLMFSFGAIALPLVTSRFANGDLAQCRRYLTQVIRYSTLLVLPLAVIIAATAEELLILFYSEEYSRAHQSLTLLVFGVWLIGLISIMAHMMIAIGKEHLMAAMALGAIALDAVFNMVLIPYFGLVGAALATTLSALGLLIVCGGYVLSRIGLDLTFVSVLRLTGLSIALYIAPGIPYLAETPLIVQYVILYAGFGIALVVVRELGPMDWAVIRQLVQTREK